MVIVVDDRRRRVVIVGLTSDHFSQLAEIIQFARLRGCSNTRRVARELHLSIPRLICLQGRLTPVLQLSLTELIDLNYIMLWFLGSIAPRYEACAELESFSELLQTLEATNEALLDSARDRNWGISKG